MGTLMPGWRQWESRRPRPAVQTCVARDPWRQPQEPAARHPDPRRRARRIHNVPDAASWTVSSSFPARCRLPSPARAMRRGRGVRRYRVRPPGQAPTATPSAAPQARPRPLESTITVTPNAPVRRRRRQGSNPDPQGAARVSRRGAPREGPGRRDPGGTHQCAGTRRRGSRAAFDSAAGSGGGRRGTAVGVLADAAQRQARAGDHDRDGAVHAGVAVLELVERPSPRPGFVPGRMFQAAVFRRFRGVAAAA